MTSVGVGRFHTAMCTSTEVYTVGKNLGQLGFDKHHETTLGTPRLVSGCVLHVEGNYESRNRMERRTERGTEVRCGPRAGLTQKSVKCLFQCRTEAKHTYLFTKVACIACFRVFPRVGRGQRSRAYLMSFNEKVRRAFIYRRHRTPAFC